MAQRHQRGWLKKEKRTQGETWVLFFRTTRQSDGKRVENKVPIGLVRHLPEASSAWAEVERLVDDDPRRFGFHNLRHSLASFLIRIRTDPKTVQTLFRHSDVKLTLQFYTHAVSPDGMVAAGKMPTAILSHAPDKNGLSTD
jgi:integrase